MTASKGLRPAWLFLSSAASLTTASISARKLSKGTRALSASSGSPLALIALRRLSRSKKHGCPTAFPCAADVGTRESDLRRARQCYFSRCPQEISPAAAVPNELVRFAGGTATDKSDKSFDARIWRANAIALHFEPIAIAKSRR